MRIKQIYSTFQTFGLYCRTTSVFMSPEGQTGGMTSTCPFVYVSIRYQSRWRHNWKSAQVVNSHLVCDPTIQQPGFDLPRQQWSLLNRYRTEEQGHCGACRRKWQLTDTDLCPCGETQTMSNIVESCPDKTEWRLISATLCG